MTRRGARTAAEPYSPQRRTALVFSGTGTDGAYHAGVLRALDEAGVKLDVVGGRGVGVVAALFAAVDGGQRLWDEKGYWKTAAVRQFYSWRGVLRFSLIALTLAALIVITPLAFVAIGLLVLPIDFLLKLVGVSAANGAATRYLAFVEAAFAPTALPTWLPRLALLVLIAAASALIARATLARGSRRLRGPVWWRLAPAPLSAAAAASHLWGTMWDLMRGATPLAQPAPSELGRRYTEMLGENIGQPGFRELVVAVHDIDAHRDLVCAMVSGDRRATLVRRPTTEEADARRAELLDLSGVGRDYFSDVVSAALSVPLATEPHSVQFNSEAYWRGETHRLCDRPGSLLRLVEELAAIDVQQVIVVTAASESRGPHALTPARVDGRGRVGEYVHSSEAAAVRDLVRQESALGMRLYTICPQYNPVGPFDFAGGFDDRSDRRQPLSELLNRGYEDAYHQFIEPVVAASGERVGQI